MHVLIVPLCLKYQILYGSILYMYARVFEQV